MWRSCAAASPHNTHELSAPKKIEYRHHPLFKTEVKVVRALRSFVDEIDIVQLPDGFQIAVPRWMLDPVICSQLPKEAKPRVALTALFRLAELVRSNRLPNPIGTAFSDTSPQTKGQNVSRPKFNLSPKSITSAQESILGEIPRTDARALQTGVNSDPSAHRTQSLRRKEPR